MLRSGNERNLFWPAKAIRYCAPLEREINGGDSRAINISPRWGEIHRTYFFHKCCDGIRKARLNLLDAFSQAIVAVSSTNASSS